MTVKIPITDTIKTMILHPKTLIKNNKNKIMTTKKKKRI